MKRRRRRFKMPDARLPLRALVSTLPGLIGLAVLALVAWLFTPTTPERAVEAADRAVRALERQADGP